MAFFLNGMYFILDLFVLVLFFARGEDHIESEFNGRPLNSDSIKSSPRTKTSTNTKRSKMKYMPFKKMPLLKNYDAIRTNHIHEVQCADGRERKTKRPK